MLYIACMKNRVRELRAERNWTQAELADRLGVSRQTVNAIEVGKYDPSLPLALKIARLFGILVEEIFDDEVKATGRKPKELRVDEKGISRTDVVALLRKLAERYS